MLDVKLSKEWGNSFENTKCKEAAVSIQLKHIKQMEPISINQLIDQSINHSINLSIDHIFFWWAQSYILKKILLLELYIYKCTNKNDHGNDNNTNMIITVITKIIILKMITLVVGIIKKSNNKRKSLKRSGY